jgi:acetamidase/formamidase
MSESEYDVAFDLSDSDAHVHKRWDRDRDPVLEVSSRDVVRVDCRDADDGQLHEGMTVEDLREHSIVGHALTGPIAVEGCEPGDVLQVDVLDVEHGDWGYTHFRPAEEGVGLLPEEFDDPWAYIWDLGEDNGHFVDGIEVPLDPFPGVLGVAPDAAGPHSTSPPRRVGGNMDGKHLTEGATLFLPVEVENALFSVGDGHAAQGDGEVCIAGIEAPINVTVRLTARRDLSIDRPQFRTDGPFEPAGLDGGAAIATSGVGGDLYEAARSAVRQLIDRLERERGLDRREAYVLCSVAADLKINELVNPNTVVSAYLAERLFPEE